jgi:rhamnogalacturonan endolyase
MNILKSSRKPAARPCAGRLLALFMLVSLLATTIHAQTFNVIYSFNSTNATGYNPTAPVIQGPDNTLYGTTQLGGSGGAGVVFKVQPDGTGYTVLWNFSGGSDGGNPFAGLLLSGNTLYGTAYNGGSSGYGVIFAVNTDGSGFSNLYSFTGGLDCGNPAAGLILSGSTLYGTTTGLSAGIQYFGSIFKINTNGSGFTVLKTFKNGDGTGANPYGGLVLSGSLLYGTTDSGTPGYGTVFRVSTSGAGFTTLHSFSDGIDGGNPVGGLVLIGNELFGTTGYGTIFKINTAGGGFTVLYTLGLMSGDGEYPSGLILLGNTLYGAAAGGGSYYSGTLFSLNTDGSGLTNFYNFDGTNGNSPEAALLSSGNTLYGTASFGGTLTGGTLFAVALYGLPIITNQPMSQIVPAGSSVTFTVGADGAAPLGYQWMSNNVPVLGATNTTLTLTYVSLADSGNYSVLVTNTYFSIQLQANTNSSVVSRIAMLTVVPVLVTNQPVSQTVPSGSTVSFSVGVAGAAPLIYQWNSNSIALSGATNAALTFTNVSLAASATYSVLITNSYGGVLSSNAVLTVLLASEYVSPTFWSMISSNTVPGGFWPNFLALDHSNNIYVTDLTLSEVVKFGQNGNYLTKFGTNGFSNGQFQYPQGIAVDGSNNVYIADSSNNRIEKFDSSGTYLLQWGSPGSGNGQFSFPGGIAVDRSNNFYVADAGNNRIEKFDGSGTYLTQWGSAGSGNGQFNEPWGLAVDSNNNVYVADRYNSRIQKFNSDGTYLTQWGTGGSGNGQFYLGPQGIAVDSSNNVYVTDSGNGRVEKFTSNGSYLTQWGSFGSGSGQFNGLGGIALDSSGNFIYVVDAGNDRIQVFVNNTNIIPPIITQSPANQMVAAGLNATFTVSVAGSPPFAYQWSSNNIAVPGATNASFTLTNVSFSAAGSYSVLVTNNFGSVLSAPAILTVAAAVATTQPPTGVSATGAMLNGSVTVGPDETLAWFEWGTDTNYGNIAGATIVPGDNASNNLSATLNSLPGNFYHYRLDAANDFGIVYGNDQSFTVGFAPAATTTLPSVTSTNGATLNATVNPNGWDTTVYFLWGARYGSLTNTTPAMDIGTGTTPLNVSSFTTGLAPLTQYSYQIVASNYLGTVSGSPVNFTSPLGAFGMTSGGVYTVDTGGGLVFQVNQSSGDITSLNFNGTEYLATDGPSQIGSGLKTATVTATTYGNDYIKITVATGAANTVVSNLTHYIMVRNGDPIIYLATYVVNEPAVGELRWITRLQFDKVPNGPPQSNNNGNTGAIESTDVFGYADGHTTSKYYGRHRAMDLTYTGATGTGIGVWSVFDTRESSSGGPFYRDIENEGDGAGSDHNIFNYMNSGHEEPEAWRLGGLLYGPYAMVFTTGAPPVLPLDYSWIETGGLNLLGWVSATNRGAITGVASGIPAGFQGVVSFANTNAQYWALVSSNGTYLTPPMKTGIYTVKLYKGELAVATNSITVLAGQTNILNLASTETTPNYIFKIGEWDGTPAGLLNGSNIINLHPSDIRNAKWGPTTFTVGTDPVGNFPAIQMRLTNTPTTVRFDLSASQLTALTLHIGMTCAYNGGRPQVTINGHALSFPGVSTQPNSRSFTTGTWRGNNVNETYAFPAGDLVAGQNTLTITPVSGSTDLGPWLSAGWVYDAVELDIPNTAPAAPAAPNNLTAATAGSSQINLVWMDNSTNEVNFLIERSTDNVNFTLIGAVSFAVTNFTDLNILSDTTYFYRVRAGNAAGYSAYTQIASAPLAFRPAYRSGGNLVLSGFGGATSNAYYLLTSTNASLPVAQWQRVATNYFESSGGFSITNVVDPGTAALFYRIQLP